MTSINSSNILQLGQDYFSSIGLAAEAKSFLTSENFESAAVICLPMVCVMKENRPDTATTNQAHIHVTGENRYLFYDKDTVKNVTKSTSDVVRQVVVSKANIENLMNHKESFSSMENVVSSTITKLSVRNANDIQVQISKLRKDGKNFLLLRRCLYLNDLLIFLKYRNQNKFFAFGVSKSFYEHDYTPGNGFLTNLTTPGTTTVQNILKEISDNVDVTATLPASNDIDDMVYQQLVDDADPDDSFESNYHPEAYDGSINGTSKSSRPITNPRLGKAAIKHNNYRCLLGTAENPHPTFLKPNGLPYMEVHHLIPLGEQWRFSNKLDTKANLIPLCPLCHKKIHHGQKAAIAEMIHKLFNMRHDALSKSGLLVTMEGTTLSEELLNSFY